MPEGCTRKVKPASLAAQGLSCDSAKRFCDVTPSMSAVPSAVLELPCADGTRVAMGFRATTATIHTLFLSAGRRDGPSCLTLDDRRISLLPKRRIVTRRFYSPVIV